MNLSGGTNFVILAIVTFFVAGPTWEPRQIVLTLFVIAWGLRLSLFLLYRILMWGEDRRFDDKRDSLLKFAFFWFFQVSKISIATFIVHL